MATTIAVAPLATIMDGTAPSRKVRAVVRIRPFLPHEVKRGDKACVQVKTESGSNFVTLTEVIEDSFKRRRTVITDFP